MNSSRYMQQYVSGEHVRPYNYMCVCVSVFECVLSDSDVRMNVSWENSGGEQAVSGVMKEEEDIWYFGSLRPRVTASSVTV